MATLGKIAWIGIAATIVAMLCSCTFPIRVGYDRKSGSYKHIAQASDIDYTGEDTLNVAYSSTTSATSAEISSSASAIAKAPTITDSLSKDSSATKSTIAQATTTSSATSAISAKSSNTQKKKKTTSETSRPKQTKRRGGIEDYAKGWLGAKYVYGAAGKNKTDCSGYVMQVYKGFYNIALDHNASSMYKDPRGKKINRKNLKEGDLVFFGGFWRIDHVGIYLKGDRFIHASSSKGVMISQMDDIYWSPKYKGAKRFK